MAQTEDQRRGLPERLARDHERLDQIFEQLLAALRADAREDVLRLWTLFDDGLCRHMALEEQYLLPELARDEPREAARLAREHAQMRSTLAELAVGIDLHQVPTEMVSDFVDQLRQHALREDAIAYRWSAGEGHLSDLARQQLQSSLDEQTVLRQKLVDLGKKARAHARGR
jgi:hemerythrin-like domain-containing protein